MFIEASVLGGQQQPTNFMDPQCQP